MGAMQNFQSIPVIDFAADAKSDLSTLSPQLIRAVRAACHQVGFFYAVNHGITESTLKELFSQMAHFFALPDAVKARLDKANSPQFRGWERLGSELTNYEVDHREQVDIGKERQALVNPQPFYRCLIGPNQWPPETVAPHFKPAVEAMLEEFEHFARRVLGVMSASVGLAPEHIANVFGDDPQPYAKLITYPPTPANSNGVGAHKDSGFITLLAQDEVGGLQAQNLDGQWIDVPPRKDALIVNVGELLQILTHNYFVATPHRVTNTSASTTRYSCAYFYSPDLDMSLEPLPLDESFKRAVGQSGAHANAKLMSSHAMLSRGEDGISGDVDAERFGERYWQRWVRSYPGIAAKHHPQWVGETP